MCAHICEQPTKYSQMYFVSYPLTFRWQPRNLSPSSEGNPWGNFPGLGCIWQRNTCLDITVICSISFYQKYFLIFFWCFRGTVKFIRGRWAANWYKCSLANSIYYFLWGFIWLLFTQGSNVSIEIEVGIILAYLYFSPSV